MNVAAARIRAWRDNPLQFAVEELHFTPDKWQAEFLSVLPSQKPNEKRIALKACTGPGKTAALAVANLHFIGCRGGRGEHPRGYCTSITEDNLRGNLWPELSVWQQRSEYMRTQFRWTATRFSSVDHPETWFLEARSWPKRANAQQMGAPLSGLHARNVQVTLDESGAIPVPVLQAAEQILSSDHEWAKVLQGGNPISLEGALYHANGPARDHWYVITITGDPDNPDRSPRINIDNAREMIRLYGRNNPWVRTTILGEFPEASINALLSVDEVEAAMKRVLTLDMFSWVQKRMGVDVSRYGDDPTIFFPRQGLQAFRPVMMRHERDSPVSVNIANRVMMARKNWGQELTFIDATGGWAAGARDVLQTMGHTPINIQYHAPAPDPSYKNMRAYNHWNAAQWVKNGGSLPYDPELVAEATATTYTYHLGKMVMEDKALVKVKIGRSPNKWDALSQTFSLPDAPAATSEVALRNQLRQMARQQREQEDYNPLVERVEARQSAGRVDDDYNPII